MELAPEQTDWAKAHVDNDTTVAVTGKVTGFDVNDDGSVIFHVQGDTDTASYLAWPPKTAEQVAEEDRKRQEAEAAAQAERDRQEAEAAAASAAEEEAHQAEVAAARQRRIDAIDALPDVSQIFKDRLKEVLG